MKIVEIGNVAGVHNDDSLPDTGIIIEATIDEVKALPPIIYEDVVIVGTQALRNIPDLTEKTSLDEWNEVARMCVALVTELKRRAKCGAA